MTEIFGTCKTAWVVEVNTSNNAIQKKKSINQNENIRKIDKPAPLARAISRTICFWTESRDWIDGDVVVVVVVVVDDWSVAYRNKRYEKDWQQNDDKNQSRNTEGAAADADADEDSDCSSSGAQRRANTRVASYYSHFHHLLSLI